MSRSVNLDNSTGLMGFQQGGINLYESTELGEYVDIWLKTFKHDSVKPATYARLEVSLNAMKDYEIAKIPIGEISVFDIQNYIKQLTAKGYGLTTIRKQTQIVTAPLRQAAAMRLIKADPCVGISLPSERTVRKPKRDVSPYTDVQQMDIWDVIWKSDSPAMFGIGLMLETGLRVGELLALKWSSIDISKRRLRVTATIQDLGNGLRGVYQNSPKSQSSVRTIPLTQTALDILRKLEGQHPVWVFAGSNGERLSYEAMVYQTKLLCERANVPYKGEHVFRHTFATNCYYKGVDVKILSMMLGHSDTRVTYNTYISPHNDGFDEMYAALNR